MVSMAQRVDAPIPQPPAISLVRAAQLPKTQADDRDWVFGIRYLPEADAEASVDDYCGPSAGTFTYSRPAEVEWSPYVVLTYDLCTALSSFARDYVGRATRLIDSATPKAVEKEFWTGTLAQAKSWPNLYLRKSTASFGTWGNTTVGSVYKAIQILELALAGCGFGGQGVIHCARSALPALTASEPGLRLDGNLLRTMYGTVVVPGVGYDGSAPVGATANAATETCLYATGPVEYRQTAPVLFPDWPGGPGGPVPPAAVNKDLNTVQAWVARTALASWDGQCHFVVRATLPT